MAVQAQYPSNVLLLNNSNVQEGHDYSLQTNQGGYFDQTHILQNNNGVIYYGNPRKRGREDEGINYGGFNNNNNNTIIRQSPSPSPVNVLAMQAPPQLIELSQLRNPQPSSNLVSTGLRLSSSDTKRAAAVFDKRPPPSMFHVLSDDLAIHVRQQKEEIEQFLHAQGELLRRTLADKRQRHYRALLGVAEDTLARKLREKEAEAEKARRRNVELQARAAQLGAEAQIWQARARAQESTAASLRAHLHQAMIVGHDGGVGILEGQAADDAESMYIDPGRAGPAESSCNCKACGKRAARVLLLPCRHLSLCTECDNVSQNCPVCLCARSSSIEVFLS